MEKKKRYEKAKTKIELMYDYENKYNEILEILKETANDIIKHAAVLKRPLTPWEQKTINNLNAKLTNGKDEN